MEIIVKTKQQYSAKQVFFSYFLDKTRNNKKIDKTELKGLLTKYGFGETQTVKNFEKHFHYYKQKWNDVLIWGELVYKPKAKK